MRTEPFDNAFPQDLGGGSRGLSKREEFAKTALGGLLASGHASHGGSPLDTGLRAVQFADALIAALNRSVPT